MGVDWQGFKSKPYDLAEVRAGNEAWAAKYRPALKKRDKEQQIAREQAAALEAEKNAALEWCRANGNPHKGNSHD